MTGDLNIVRNIKLRDLFSKGPTFREPVSYSWHQNFGFIIDACEDYAWRWAKKEDVEVDTLSEWIKSITDVLKRWYDEALCQHQTRVHFKWTWCCQRTFPSLWEFRLSPQTKHQTTIHLFARDITSASWQRNLDFTHSLGEVLDNHKSVHTSFGIGTSDDELDLPYIYWIPKMHKTI